MSEQQPAGSEAAVEVKTCPSCGGTWPASRTHCLACGGSLAHVPAREGPAASDQGQIDWTWLNALSPEEDRSSGASEPTPSERRKGKWWQFWR